jgi:hypothetical protein
VIAFCSIIFLVLTVEELRPMWGASTVLDAYDIAASGVGSLLAISVYEFVSRLRREVPLCE